MASVLVADHAPLMRDAVGRALEHIKVVGEAGNATTLVSVAGEILPGLVVVGVYLKGFEIPRTLREVLGAGREVKVLVLALRDEPQVLQGMLQEGASSYMPNGISIVGFQEALIARMIGEPVYDRAVESRVARLYSTLNSAASAGTSPGNSRLTDMDLEVLRRLADIGSNVEIAKLLGVSERTTKGYVGDVLEKLGVAPRLEAVVTAVRTGLLKLWESFTELTILRSDAAPSQIR